MRLNNTKLLAVVAIFSIMTSGFFMFNHASVIGEETASGMPVMKLVDSATGLDNVTFGGTGEPIPSGGYKFTVNATLENVDDLYTFEVAILYNRSMVNCTGATANTADPNNVFYQISGGTIGVPTYFNTDPTYVATGLSAITSTVSVSGPRLLAQFNFIAQKVGTSSLELILTAPSLGDQNSYVMGIDYQPLPFLAYNLTITVNPVAPSPPTASFTFSPQTPSRGDNITFDASASNSPGGSIIDYEWDFGDNTILPTGDSTVIHAFEDYGVYNVSLMVIDDTGSGFNGTTSMMIQVGFAPNINFTYETSDLAVIPVVFTFNASLSYARNGSIALYVWDFGDGTTANSTESNATNGYVKRGVYNVTLIVIDNNGLFNITQERVFVGLRPVADFVTIPEFPNHADNITFYGDRSQQGDINDRNPNATLTFFEWYFGDFVGYMNGTFGNASVVQYSYSYIPEGTGGNYSVTLTVYDGYGLFGSVMKVVEVEDVGTQSHSSGVNVYWIALGAIFVAIVVAGVVLKKRQKPELARKERFRVV